MQPPKKNIDPNLLHWINGRQIPHDPLKRQQRCPIKYLKLKKLMEIVE